MRIGITINFDKNFYSNGLQQNVVFLFNLLNEIENFNPFYLWEGQEINPKIIDKNKCIQYKYFLTDSSFKFDLIIMMGFTFGDKVITSDNVIQDLWGLSKSNWIIGPPSTFSQFASFWNNTPIKFILKKDDYQRLTLPNSYIIALNMFSSGSVLSGHQNGLDFIIKGKYG